MKRSTVFSVFVLLSMILGLFAAPTGAQEAGTTALSTPRPADPERVTPAQHPPRQEIAGATPAGSPQQLGWQYGPPSTFQFQRFDGVFVPGPEPWGNKVYFMGGRISAPSELPDIWMFDPLTGQYTDTLVNVIEDVSNYNTDLVMDDGSGRGPAVYVVGGYDKDGGGGGGSLGLVQRFYPQTGEIEGLPDADDWPGQVGGGTVAGMGTATVNDIIYVFGGWNSGVAPYFYTGTWAFDPSQPSGSRWTDLGVTLNPGRTYIMTAVQDGMIYAMGGIYQYIGGDLIPTDAVEVLDTNNLAAGWQPLGPLPVPTAEGRGFGFDSDTRGINYLPGRIYVVGGGDWPDITRDVFEYNVAADTWDDSFPELNDRRVNLAGSYIPLYTPDPNDGLPGMWVFGGRSENGCDPPYGATEFYPLPLQEQCSILLVDDDWDEYSGEPFNGTGTYYYTSTLEALGLAYDRWDVWTQGDPSLADLQPYDTVIWFTGYAWGQTVTPTNEADLAAYLDAGGNLLLSSEDYLFDQGLTAFGAGYLGIASYSNDTNEVDLIGNAGDIIGDGLGPYTLVTPTSWPSSEDLLYTDQVTPSLNFGSPFRYQASGISNSTDGAGYPWRSVYLAWPFEGLDNLGDRVAVMNRVLNWFCFTEQPHELLLEPPSQSGSGIPGSTVPYILTLTNRTGLSDTFSLAYSFSALWPIDGPASVGPLHDGDMLSFVLTVTIPTDTNCYEWDTFSIIAASTLNPILFTDTAAITTTSMPAGQGDLDGTVYDANTGLGLPNAHVYLEFGAFYTETWTDAGGAYGFPDLLACTYTGGAGADRYESALFTVTLTAATTTTQDLYLDAGWPYLTPTAVSVALPPAGSTSTTLGLVNLGTGILHYTISEVPVDISWLTVDPTAGMIYPSTGQAVDLFFDAAGLPPNACYSGTLQFLYDDPYVMEEFVPVELCICDEVADVDFNWTPPTPTAGLPVTFTATASGTAPILFHWDLGDGTVLVTSDTMATHTYTEAGDYQVALTATNCATATATVVHDVVVAAACEVVYGTTFDWTPPTPTAGLPVTFTATASGTAPILFHWDLGDGTVLVTSDTMATHTYTEAGDYQVALTATNCVTATAAVVHNVVVAEACEAVYGTAFNWMPLTPTVDQGVTFSAQASGTTPIAFTWDFGDGSGLVTTATLAAHTYTATGSYTVTLSAANGCGEEVVIDLLTVASAEWRIYLPVLFKNH